jgi:demethylmenaquinone methyltransferase/2-methoxy-6-polyprenyl-1,4-benzoquinol methylase
LRAGAGRSGRNQLPFVAADALHLPFADAVFDAVTISFGLRNIVDVPAALAEFARVVKPGGRLLVCEFSTPVGPVWHGVRVAPWFRVVYMNYLMRALPWVARKVSSNPDAYVYLAESIRSWPVQQELARTIARAGWGEVHYRNLTGGIVALHRAVRPS